MDCKKVGAFVPLPACRKCPLFISRDGGLGVNCDYEVSEPVEEPSVVGEPRSRW